MVNTASDTDGLRELAARLNTAVVHMHRHLRRLDAGVELPGAQASALALLVSAGAHTIGSLAGFELVAAPTMTRIVSALEERGLVERKREGDDLRVVTVEATEAGRMLILDALSARLASLADGLGRLSVEERAELARALDLLAKVRQ